MKEKSMLQKSLLSFVLAVFATMNFSCSHGAKKEEVNSQNSPKAAISTDSISSDPLGSDSGKIDGLFTIHFAFNESKLDPGARETLGRDKIWIESHPNIKIQIEGHCDHRGSNEYNLALGERRARAVMKYLTDLGLSKDRLSFISYGDERPIANGDTEEDFAKNRRANFVPLK